MEIIHVAGPRQLEETRAPARRRGGGDRYRLVGWLDNLPEAVAAADLVVSRSGGSVFELAAIGRPSILVPYPHATADHQAKNARWLAEAGAAVVRARCRLHRRRRLRGLVGALLSDRRRLEAMAEAARAVGARTRPTGWPTRSLALARRDGRRRAPPRAAGGGGAPWAGRARSTWWGSAAPA